ncbi:FAD:protein FMN transferase [Psychrosphaera aestuarii]|uniref:FAD:protein FMN transferase n=1 Tax=Psychrosphaera aestuarii TaxID=1266052 RepID=UPI001FD3D24D|nr:FAD:protein FMN transferase [Psychrosphaera aestuarii]
MNQRTLNIEHRADCIAVSFFSMASPCEVLFDSKDEELITQLAKWLTQETWRIEDKYSRYQTNNVMHQINNSNGHVVSIDAETARLLMFADACYQASDGMFDVTSGVLRKAWKFDGGKHIPSHEEVAKLLHLIGWQKVQFTQKQLALPAGMELDLGGIGKEYAVDSVAQGLIQRLTAQQQEVPFLVNFGGDIFASSPRSNGKAWVVAIDLKGLSNTEQKILSIEKGGLATSGDANRFLLKNGKRYTHILNPKSGWPIENAPRSITVAAATCIQAGMMCTIAMTCGDKAKEFLTENALTHWIYT